MEGATITELNMDYTVTGIPKTRQIKNLDKFIAEDMACSACYAGLVHALDRLKGRGELNKVKGKIHIGQGYP